MPNETLSPFLVNLAVPVRFYNRMLQHLAAEIAAETLSPSAASPAPSPSLALSSKEELWAPPERIPALRRLLAAANNNTAIALMDATSADPGKRVSFIEVAKMAHRTNGGAQASLAGFSKLIKKNFGFASWPVEYHQEPDGQSSYSIAPSIAEAWIASRKKQP